MNDLGFLLGPFVRRISNLVARGTVGAVDAGKKMQSLQVRLLAGETKDAVEHFEPYGFTSNPKTGAEGVALFMDGDRSHGVVIVVADRRFRLTGLVSGEAALYDDQGQKVHLTRNGIVIDGAGKDLTFQNAPTITMKAATKVRMETQLLEVTGNIKDNCDVPTGKTMAQMRTTYNGHTHHENDVHGETNNPTQQM
jgi:phage baseplate assembly protein V